jgi:hypothetical protein
MKLLEIGGIMELFLVRFSIFVKNNSVCIRFGYITYYTVVDWWWLVLIPFLSKDGEPEYKSVRNPLILGYFGIVFS